MADVDHSIFTNSCKHYMLVTTHIFSFPFFLGLSKNDTASKRAFLANIKIRHHFVRLVGRFMSGIVDDEVGRCKKG